MKLKIVISRIIPYLLLILFTLPIIIGYVWILISTFSTRIYGLLPVDKDGKFGGVYTF